MMIRSILVLSIFSFIWPLNSVQAEKALRIGAIPDQKPEKLNRRYLLLSNELENKLDVPVRYIPVTNYAASVTGFRTKSLDLVWFGGLTGVQSRLQSPGAIVIAQRDIDRRFKSVFIANSKSNINKIKSINGLNILKNKRFTYGSENSTSGRLMPEYYLNKAGVRNNDFKGGRPGFSGSHDATIALVQSGSYQAGALNSQIWDDNLKTERVNKSKVKVIWITPSYNDYHWLAQGNLDDKFGKGFTRKLQKVFLNLNKNNPKDRQILELFGAKKFIKASSDEYKQIENIGRKIGKIR